MIENLTNQAYEGARMSYQPYQPPVNQPNGGSPLGGGIMQTAKFGMYGLIATAAGILLNIVGLPFGGLFNLAGLVLAIMSLVKKENPKWPAWITISLSIIGIVLALAALIILVLFVGATGALN